ncbi:hypothetical protein AB8A31_00450 [Tardiphaga sp. 804_B3_N1_9]|uniref:hypothetical protein n=1 Tax=Tardiphaga TaxID=1395974 RepID=UPI001585ED20|nr:hypothetical protein [Tardiphaga robiniae]NUU39656.1 hypothetical protein [Tardiphaga robiniae]
MTLELKQHVQNDDKGPFHIDELIKCRRAKRGFTDKAVPVELVKDILSIARFTVDRSGRQKPFRLCGSAVG